MARDLLSVVIATRNRARFLATCLDSIANGAYPRDRYEVIVVDNGSTDATPRLLERERRRARLDLHVVHEPTPGLGRARNAGVAAARGQAVVFLDDDAVATAGWLTAYADEFFLRGSALVQARILPLFLASPPPWATGDGIGVFGALDEGPTRHPVRGNLHGVSFAVRSFVLVAVGPFREDLGAGRVGLGEDTEFGIRARRLGYEIVYRPDALVRHHVERRRLARSWYLRRQFRSGLCQPLFETYEEWPPRTVLAFARQASAQILVGMFASNARQQMRLWGAVAAHLGRTVQICLGRKHVGRRAES